MNYIIKKQYKNVFVIEIRKNFIFQRLWGFYGSKWL